MFDDIILSIKMNQRKLLKRIIVGFVLMIMISIIGYGVVVVGEFVKYQTIFDRFDILLQQRLWIEASNEIKKISTIEENKLFAPIQEWKDEWKERGIKEREKEYLQSLQYAKEGDRIVFGKYETDNEQNNNYENVSWIVLAKENNRLLVLSESVLFCTNVQNADDYVNEWKYSAVRESLTNIYNIAFSEKEKMCIPSVSVVTEGDFVSEVRDQVFVLSVEEVERYLDTNAKRVATTTAYVRALAKKNDIYAYEKGTCAWGVRMNKNSKNVVVVESDGSIDKTGRYLNHIGVRPAMWIEIE
jgi:hypothetical protein